MILIVFLPSDTEINDQQVGSCRVLFQFLLLLTLGKY